MPIEPSTKIIIMKLSYFLSLSCASIVVACRLSTNVDICSSRADHSTSIARWNGIAELCCHKDSKKQHVQRALPLLASLGWSSAPSIYELSGSSPNSIFIFGWRESLNENERNHIRQKGEKLEKKLYPSRKTLTFFKSLTTHCAQIVASPWNPSLTCAHWNVFFSFSSFRCQRWNAFFSAINSLVR